MQLSIKLGHRIKILRCIQKYTNQRVETFGNAEVHNVSMPHNESTQHSTAQAQSTTSPKKPVRERVIEYNELGEKVIVYKNVVPNSAFDGEFDEERNKAEFKQALEEVRTQEQKRPRKTILSNNPIENALIRNKITEEEDADPEYDDMPELEEELKVCKTLTDYGNTEFNILGTVITEDFGIGDESVWMHGADEDEDDYGEHAGMELGGQFDHDESGVHREVKLTEASVVTTTAQNSRSCWVCYGLHNSDV